MFINTEYYFKEIYSKDPALRHCSTNALSAMFFVYSLDINMRVYDGVRTPVSAAICAFMRLVGPFAPSPGVNILPLIRRGTVVWGA